MKEHRLSPFRSVASALALSCALFACPHVAHAQGGNQALAQSLFDAGRKLMLQKNYVQACPKFEDSERLDPSPGTLLNLGECYEGLGKTATAWARYESAATMAHTAGRTELETLATNHADKLQPHLSKLTIQGPATSLDGLRVQLDKSDVGSASFGTAVAIDPGQHTLEASAPGYKNWSKQVTVGPDGAQVTEQVPPLEKLPPGAQPSRQPAESNTTTGAAVMHDLGKAHGSTKTVALVVGGAGIVVAGVGAVFGIMAASQASNAKSDPTLCPNKVCTPAGRKEIDSASTKATISTIGVGVGAAAVATGVVLFLLSPSSPAEHPPSEAATRVTPLVGPGATGLSLAGSF
jgi:PEGA domain